MTVFLVFPGATLLSLMQFCTDDSHILEVLAICAAVSLTILSTLGFAGAFVHTELTVLSQVFLTANLVLAVAILIINLRRANLLKYPELGKTASVILLLAAIALASTTLFTPRDIDDWFYLAHIRDYVNDIPINSENAIFDNGQPASPRAWYGGWWVAEAMLSRATGMDPVRLHQVMLPLLLLPFSVFALFTLARQIFRSDKVAYLACFLQVVFFLSSAYPSDSAGWAFLCRTAQDKTVACLIMVPVVTALALRLWRRMTGWEWREDGGSHWGLFALYVLCLVGSTLVHPMAAVWSGIAILPFIVIETIRDRRRRTAIALVLILIPFVVSGLILLEGRMATVSTLEGRAAGPHEGKGIASHFAPYFPGGGGRFRAGDRVLVLSDRLHIGHPLLITRYPLATLGLVLSFVLLRYVRQSGAARYLVVLTFSVLILTFVPGVANLTSAAITRKMLYRLTWILPWGLTTAFVLSRISPRIRWAWLLAAVIALAACRGNPADYFASLSAMRNTARTSPDLEEVLHSLAAEPVPQGVVFASSQASLRIPGFVGDAYPVTFRYEGARTAEEIRDLFQYGALEGPVRQELEALGARYVIAEKSRSLGRGFEVGTEWAHPVYGNKNYGLWRIDLAPPSDRPPGD